MAYSDYVIIRNQVFRWEEKAPFVPSGKSVLGAIEYDKEKGKIKCHECGNSFLSISNHILRGHGVTVREYKLKHGIGMKSRLESPDHCEAKTFNGKVNFASTKRKLPSIEQRNAAKYRRMEAMKAGALERKNINSTCRAQCLARINQIADELGRTPTGPELGHSLKASARAHFGNLTEFARSAGLKPNPSGDRRAYTNDILIELLRDFYVLNRRMPSKADYRSGSLPNQATFIRRFGSLGEAFHAAGLSKEYEKWNVTKYDSSKGQAA